jgi:large subunit ribosomal protein L20
MRVKTGVVRRQGHKRILKAAKGYWMDRSTKYKAASEAVLHAGQYAFNGRRIRRRDFRKLWIIRLNAALKPFEMRYSVFIKKLADNKVALNRKMLSEIAIHDPAAFKAIFTSLK